jgi:hypothetical protein
MREEYGALMRRAAAAVGASVALHIAVVSLVGSVFLGTLLTAVTEDASPLVVEIIAGDARPAPASAAMRPGRSGPTGGRRSVPPRAPADVPSGAEGPTSDAEVSTSDIEVASDPSAPTVSEKTVALAPETASGEGRIASEADADRTQPQTVARAEDQAIPAAPDAPAHVPDGSPAVPGSPMNFARLDEVTRNPSVSARAEGQPFVGRREVFEFLLDHPDFATHISRALRLGRYRMWRTDEGLFVDDGWGATGRVFVVYAASGTRVLYARGEFQHGLLPAISGEAVVTINYDVQPAADGRDLLSAAISSQLKIGGALGDLVAKLAGSLATEKAEKESLRLVRMFARVLQALDEKPAAVYASLRERPDVPQRELEQFRVLLKLP